MIIKYLIKEYVRLRIVDDLNTILRSGGRLSHQRQIEELPGIVDRHSNGRLKNYLTEDDRQDLLEFGQDYIG